MKDIKDYIIEAKDIHSKWKDVAKKLSKEDKEWIKKYAFDKKSNQIYTMEELEQRMWKGDLKDQIEDIYDHLIDSILYEDCATQAGLPSTIDKTLSLSVLVAPGIKSKCDKDVYLVEPSPTFSFKLPSEVSITLWIHC